MIQTSDGRPITVTVDRDGHVVRLARRAPVWKEHRWIWGFESTAKPIPYPLGQAAQLRGLGLWGITIGTVTGIAALFKPHSRRAADDGHRDRAVLGRAAARQRRVVLPRSSRS